MTTTRGVPLAPYQGPRLTVRWITKQVDTILSTHEACGDIARISFGRNRSGVLTRSADDIRQLFGAPPEVVPSATGGSPIAPLVGTHSLLTLNGPAHLRHRKLLLPPFHGDRMRAYADDIAQLARDEVAGWREGEERALHPAMQSITLEVILRIVFGVDDAARQDELRQAIVELLSLTDRPLLMLPTYWFAVRQQRLVGPVRRIAQELDRIIYREIALRRQASDLEGRTDVLSMLLLARDEEGSPMSDQELRDELITILLAGHETTASGLAWAFERLVRTPEAMAMAQAAAVDDDAAALDAVFHETLRLRPVVPVVARVIQEPMELSGYELDANEIVVISILGAGLNPARFDDPLAFRPERFLGTRPDPATWVPFGGGVRRCIGAAFAQLEARIVLREVLRHAELVADRAADEDRKRRNVTTVPARGATVRIAQLRPPLQAK